MPDMLSRRSVLIGAAAGVAALVPNQSFANSPNVHTVAIRSLKFKPRVVQARIGDTIRWTNSDVAPHTATADEFGWDTGEIAKGQSGEITVTEGMETSYFCAFHPHMKGEIEIIS